MGLPFAPVHVNIRRQGLLSLRRTLFLSVGNQLVQDANRSPLDETLELLVLTHINKTLAWLTYGLSYSGRLLLGPTVKRIVCLLITP